MDRTILSAGETTRGDIAAEIRICIKILQEAADYLFSLPQINPGSYQVPISKIKPVHRVIVGEPAILQFARPYMVGFCGTRLPDQDGSITKDLVQVDNHLIELLEEYGIGLYNSAQFNGQYKNTVILPDKSASKRWAAHNAVHQAAVNKLAPRSYQDVLKFSGFVNGWPTNCQIEVDGAIWLQG